MREGEVTDPASLSNVWENKHPQTETFIHAVDSTYSFQYSHAIKVNELTLPLIALSCQEVFIVFDLVCQLWVQIELCWKLRDPVPGRQKQGVSEKEREMIKIYWGNKREVDLLKSTP